MHGIKLCIGVQCNVRSHVPDSSLTVPSGSLGTLLTDESPNFINLDSRALNPVTRSIPRRLDPSQSMGNREHFFSVGGLWPCKGESEN
jgi:hypothetical protein